MADCSVCSQLFKGGKEWTSQDDEEWCTLEDGVAGHADLHARLVCGQFEVIQLLDRLLAHVLQLADMVVHVGDLDLARRPRPPRRHLEFDSWILDLNAACVVNTGIRK